MIVSRLNARQTRALTGLALGAWLFALVVGIAHACSLHELGVTPGERGVTSASATASGEGRVAGCDRFCTSDVPVVGKVPSIGEQSAAQLPTAAATGAHIVLVFPAAFSPAQAAHPSMGVSPVLHFTRLRL
ncbi:MAG: hypothetical protein KGL70_05775 [Betaproteobacteria bacterium]|nr:hypothetical protein [Betaproteobacteria bacterium]MDE2358877.1 hypothetical protein [Betaproteobacteria bacterium]